MSSANVLPSAPEYAETVQQLYPMNEIAQINAEDCRLKKISDPQTELKNEADHYRQVAKKVQKNTCPHTHLSCRSWFSFCGTVVSNPCNSLKGRYTRGSLLLKHAPETRSRVSAPTSTLEGHDEAAE